MREAHQLIDAYLDGTIDAAGLAELRAWVVSDAAHADTFANRSLLHRHAYELHTAAEPVRQQPEPTAIAPARRGFPFAAGLAIAATVVVSAAALAVYLFAFASNPQPNTGQGGAGVPIATLIESTGTLIYDDNIARQGAEYAAGTYTIDSGSAELLLSNRVTVGMAGRSQLVMHDPMHVSLYRGAASFNCPKGTEGFIVRVGRGASIVDLGTAFRVVRPESGPTLVWVTEGRVGIHLTDAHDVTYSLELAAGEFGWIDASDADAPRFVRQIDTTPAPITGVTATATSELTGSFDRAAAYVVDGGGLDPETGAHSIDPTQTMWLSRGVGFPGAAGEDRHPAITFDLGGLCIIESLRVWNYNEQVKSLFGRGVKDARILVSYDGESFQRLTDPADGDELFAFTPATGRADADFSQRIEIDHAAPITHVKIEVVTTHEGSDFDAGVIADQGFAGLSEVRFVGVSLDAQEKNETSSQERSPLGE